MAGLLAATLAAMIAVVGMAVAQNSPAAPAPSAAAPQMPSPPASAQPASPAAAGPALPSQPPPVEKRGFLNDFGHWWDDSITSFKAKMQEQQAKFEAERAADHARLQAAKPKLVTN